MEPEDYIGTTRTVLVMIEGESYYLTYVVENARVAHPKFGVPHIRLSGYSITETEDTGCAMYPYSVGRPVSERLS